MELRALGTTGLRVSALGLGTVKLGRNQGVRYPQPYARRPAGQVTAPLESVPSWRKRQ